MNRSQDVKPAVFAGWPAGIDNRSAPFALAAGACRNAVNVDVRSSGRVKRRGGYRAMVADPGAHSLFACPAVTLYVADGKLKRLRVTPDVTTTEVLDANWGDAPTRYAMLGSVVLFSNGGRSARFEADEVQCFGVPTPLIAPTVEAITTGGLDAGQYQVAISWRRRGVESGLGPISVVDVPALGGVQLSDFPPTPEEVDEVGVYVSEANGDLLYWAADVTPDTDVYLVPSEIRTVPCDVQFRQALPPVELLAVQNGRVLGAVGPVLYMSLPFNPHLMEGLEGLVFESNITGLAPVTDGVYVATESSTWFLSLADTPSRVEVSRQAAVPGAASEDVVTAGGLWVGSRGFMRGGPGGQLQNLLGDHVTLPLARRGAVLVREVDGERQAVVSLEECRENPLINEEWRATETARRGNAL